MSSVANLIIGFSRRGRGFPGFRGRNPRPTDAGIKGLKQLSRRATAFVAAIALIAAGCSSASNNIERADDLGLPLPGIPSVAQPNSASAAGAGVMLPGTLLPDRIGDYSETYRDAFVEQWMARSDYLCRQYKDKIIRASRDWRLGTDVLTTLLAGLATIFTPVNTIRPLAGAATIVSGAGAAVDSDVFSQQTGELIAAAIQTARENQANQIEHNLSSNPKIYNIYRAQRDVIEYHNMCSLETALRQARASLQATSPDGGRTPPAAQGSQTPGGLAAPQIQEFRNLPGAKDFSISKASEPVPLPIPRPPPTLQPNGRTDYERRLSRKLVSDMQAALCVAPINGVLGETTRTAAKTYQDARGLSPSPDGTIDDNIATSIRDAIRKVGSCSDKGYLNAFEVGRYGVSPAGPDAIRELQRKLKVETTGSFLPLGAENETRKAITAVRKNCSECNQQLDGQVDVELIAKAKELQAR